MTRTFVKLKELTPEIYLRYKKSEFDDREIARLYDCSLESITDWKRHHGLIGVTMRNWATWDKYFPEEVAKLKKRFMELYNMGWKHEFIAEEMEMSRQQLTVFKNRYFPDLMKRVKYRLSDQEKEICKKNGIKINTAEVRIRGGMDPAMAITIPPDRPIGKNTGKHRKVVLKEEYTDEEIRQAEKNGISRHTLYRRTVMEWPKERALNEPNRLRKGENG